MKIEGIEIQDYLDAKEERIKAIKKIKERTFELLKEEYGLNISLCNLYPGRKDDEKRLRDVTDEICWRMSDYFSFMEDMKKDWDLNYDDY